MFIHKLSRFNLWIVAMLCLTACASPTSPPSQSSPTTAPTGTQLTAEAQPTPEITATQETQVTPTPEVKSDEVDDESDSDSDELEAENEFDEAGGQPKVTICHNASKNNPHSITIAQPALKAHLAHGDTPGPCP